MRKREILTKVLALHKTILKLYLCRARVAKTRVLKIEFQRASEVLHFYVSMYVSCVYVCTNIPMYICLCGSMHVCMFVCMYVCMYVGMYVGRSVGMSATLCMCSTLTHAHTYDLRFLSVSK